MPQFDIIAPTSELEALNEMLATIGEVPVSQAQLDSPSLPSVELAVSRLRANLRATLARGWRFNREWGVEIAPTADSPFSWEGTDGTTEDLNIFEVPSGLMSWDLTDTAKQIHLSVVGRRPKVYSGTAEKVFYDVKLNRDGFLASDFEFLYIDPVYAWSFEDAPQTFRTYVTLRAARDFQARIQGDDSTEAFTRRDLAEALRDLRRDQGMEETINLFDNYGSARFLGRKRRIRGGRFIDRRDSPGHV